jgi:peptidoglycan/LPS O-acetylase OafA/YrhL
VTSVAYRADIDGLRAIAVLAVVGYHAVPGFVPGGYVGVDVFFVISGFLITGLLLADVDANKLSLSNFFSRRIRRIFPALILVIASTLFAGWFLLLASEFLPLSRSAAAAAGFVANFQFWREVGYFDSAAELKPLLHLWSLSVEEQFYLLWPLTLLFIAPKSTLMARSAWVLLIVSFVLNVALVAKHGEATFFMLPTRLWELMAGALLAIRARQQIQIQGQPVAIRSRWFAEIISALGLTLLLLTIYFLNRERHYPGSWALLPVIGTCCLIAGGGGSWVARQLLSRRILVGIGLISYPLYLWHWPMLAFIRVIEGSHIRWQSIFAALSASVLLAGLTYRYIERPVRRASRASPSPRLVLGLCLLMAIVGVVGIAGTFDLILPRSHGSNAGRFGIASQDWDFPGRASRREIVSEGLAVNVIGAGPKKVMIWGDSNAEQYGPRVEKLVGAANANTTVYFVTAGNCPPIRHTRISAKPGCESHAEKAFLFARDGRASTVIIAAQWAGYLTSSALVFSKSDEQLVKSAARDAAITEFASTITALRATGKNVVVVLNIPVSDELDPRNMLKRFWNGDIETHTEGISFDAWIAARAYLTGNLAEVASNAGAIVIDPSDLLCNKLRCLAVDERGEPIYRDGRHLRARFVRERVTYLDEVIR